MNLIARFRASLPAVVLLTVTLSSCSSDRYDTFDSGGELIPEQAAFDVTYYDLDLVVDPTARSIDGSLRMDARIVSPTRSVVLDLHDALTVDSVATASGPLGFKHKRGRIRITLGESRSAGDSISLRVYYSGEPHVASNPPWSGGFTWSQTPAGEHWISTTCQGEGADVWWPVKDHPGDEPDSMRMHFTVPAPLVVASNGRLESTEERGDSTRYNWFVSTPINTYNVTLNAADFRVLRTRHVSPRGETYPVEFYVLPENVQRGGVFLAEINNHLTFYEELLGPYPFRDDKYGVVQTPHLGMEHQTLIAYGANFDNGAMTGGVDWGFDALHHHELAHEWWGNLVTNSDWSDMWLHEGFGTYMQALYVEREQGPDRYREYMQSLRDGINSDFTLAPEGIRTADEIYDGQLYTKGAWVLHTLRYLIGDAAFFRSLREMAYPSRLQEEREKSGGCGCRFATTEEFIEIVNTTTGKDLTWFFNYYLRQPELPDLAERVSDGFTRARWNVPSDAGFLMPIQFSRTGSEGEETVVLVPDEQGVVEMEGEDWLVDAQDWILSR